MAKTMIYNIEIEQGASFSLDITVSTQSGPMDLTGFTGKCQVRSEIGGDLLVEAELVFTERLEGKLRLDITDEQSAAIPVDVATINDKAKYVYDAIITSPDGVATKILKGTAFVYPGVTE